jgi:bifunctional DNase/RNase
MIQISSLGFMIDPRTGQQVLFLANSEKTRVVSIALDSAEAHAINMSLSAAKSIRPLTHDLLLNAIAIDHKLEAVQIDLAPDNLLVAFISLSRIGGKGTKTLIANPVDAITIALRAKADIFVTELLMTTTSLPTDPAKEVQEREDFKQFVETLNASDFNNKGPKRFNSPEVA